MKCLTVFNDSVYCCLTLPFNIHQSIRVKRQIVFQAIKKMHFLINEKDIKNKQKRKFRKKNKKIDIRKCFKYKQITKET